MTTKESNKVNNKVFSIDTKMQELLSSAQSTFGYKTIEETVQKSFMLMVLMNNIHSNGGEFVYKDKDDNLFLFPMFEKEEELTKESLISALAKKKK